MGEEICIQPTIIINRFGHPFDVLSVEILRVLLAFECRDLLIRRNVCAQPFLCWLQFLTRTFRLTTEISLDSADEEGDVFSCRRRDLHSAHSHDQLFWSAEAGSDDQRYQSLRLL